MSASRIWTHKINISVWPKIEEFKTIQFLTSWNLISEHFIQKQKTYLFSIVQTEGAMPNLLQIFRIVNTRYIYSAHIGIR